MERDDFSAIAQSFDAQKAFLASIVQPLNSIRGDGCIVIKITRTVIAIECPCRSRPWQGRPQAIPA
jgi:hypothetical protein